MSVSTLKNVVIVLTALSIVLEHIEGSVKCPNNAPSGSSTTDMSETIFDFGHPVLFVTTSSQKYDPYSLLDHYRRTAILEEYLLVGYHKHNAKHQEEDSDESELHERLQMVFFDGVKKIIAKAAEKPDLVRQNLEKELYWRYFNSTGIFPSMTIVNTTKIISVQFHTAKENHQNEVSFIARITAKDFFWEPQVPYNVIFEIPANSRVLRKQNVMIQYQSFSLWRWRLSPIVLEWKNITDKSDQFKNNTLITNFHRIDNPCIKDMFLLYVPRTSKTGDEKLVYLASPLIQSHLDENWFYDMKTEEHPWWPHAPETIVLTNDHLVVLTEKSIWISNSLNDSTNPDIDLDMKEAYTEKPNLFYSEVNPCANFEDDIDCFLQANATHLNYTIQRLFYTPVCYLFQFPFYDDYLILTIERNSYYNGELETDFTVLYAEKPYLSWRILFSNVALYKRFEKSQTDEHVEQEYILHTPIKRIVGIFFNHHLRHFDITVELNVQPNKKNRPKYVRFVLPEPATAFNGYGELLSDAQLKVRRAHNKKLRQLNGTTGDGFSEFEFPENFEMDNFVVNGDTLDMLFLGNQLWIAEAGGPFVYIALAGISPVEGSACPESKEFTTSKIKECSFNHPDKVYLCMNQDRRLMLAGKIGSRYSPIVVRVDYIKELAKAQKVYPWATGYFCDLIQKHSVFVAAFSGKILFWYLHEPEEESKAVQDEIARGCTQMDQQPVLCDDIEEWKTKQCTAESSGHPGFSLLVLNPSQFVARKQSTDGPLAPFLVNSNTVLLYEAFVPQVEGMTYDFFNQVFVGQKIFCSNYELKKEDANDKYLRHNCELFLRHIKPVEKYLDGFRRVLYATVVKSIPLLPLPTDVVVLVPARSNKALVKVNDYINNPAWSFKNEHIGQTLYIPGNFSLFLTGFPIENDATIMEGYTTMHFQHEQRFLFRAFFIFLMDMSTEIYRKVQVGLANVVVNNTKARWDAIDKEKQEVRTIEMKIRANIEKRWMDSEFARTDPATGNTVPVFRGTVSPVVPREQEEKDLLKIQAKEQINMNRQPHSRDKLVVDPAELVYGDVEYDKRLIWYVDEGECNYILTLVNNPVLKTSGGRISLDLYDRISFEVLLRPLTSLGKILMYRPLIVVTNSNPSVLRVEVVEKLKGSPQFIQFLLSPTGFKKGVAVITVRSRVVSLHCPQSSSLTLIVLCHRDVGRRLHVNYPIPSCKPLEELGMYPRPWFNEVDGCINAEELLDNEKSEIIRFQQDKRIVSYVSLPANYRPPSFDGTDIPQTRNVYNADPSKPAYKAWYKISRETIQLNRCAIKSSKKECACGDVDRLLDDEELSECKEKVFFTKRTGTADPIPMTISYDRIMQDSDQNPELFLPKRNCSISIEEVNGRGEWYITSDHTPYLRMINTNYDLHKGRRYYDMNKFKVTLLGTGLFHFKVKLGNFESFDPVTGYFMLYADTDDINHVHLFMILLGTIIFCMTLVFIGFLVNRKRLSSMLPIQPMSNKRKLKLL